MTILPTLGVYALSFTFTGIYWINHHHLVHRTDQADERDPLRQSLLPLLPVSASFLHLLPSGEGD